MRVDRSANLIAHRRLEPLSSGHFHGGRDAFHLRFVSVVVLVGLFVGQGKSTKQAPAETIDAATIQPAAPYGDRLKDALELVDIFETPSSVTSVEQIGLVLGLFNNWASLLDESHGMTMSEDTQAKRKALFEKLSAVQKAALPVLRDKYGPLVRERLWENDITARTIGSGYRTIDLVGALFAANRNIAKVNDTLYPTLIRLRFTRSQYRWFDGADKYTYYQIVPPKDGDIAIFFDNGTFRIVK